MFFPTAFGFEGFAGGGVGGGGGFDVDAFGLRHAISADFLDRGTVLIHHLGSAIVRVKRGLAQLRGHVLDQSGCAFEETLCVVTGSVSFRTELRQKVDEAVRAPIDHGEALAIFQSSFTDRLNR